MSAEWINIGLAFIEGFALIISPCILPILPIILSGSLAGKKSRPVGIIIGFVITFTIVTLFSKALITFTHLGPDTIRNVSLIILLLLGIMMMSTYLTEKFNLLTQGLTRVGNSFQSANNPESGFWGGIIFGGLVGIIWTPCAGPILAAVIVQTVLQKTTLSSVLTVVAFAIGAGLPMLLIALIGRQAMSKFHFLREKTGLLRKLLGLVIIISVIFLYENSASFTFSSSQSQHPAQVTSLINALERPYKAPEIAGIDAWINSQPLTITQLKGKVILIDFWTYSCINCIRTLPYLKDWYAKYHDNGLVIIGIHSPEFEFEHDLNNVKNAVIKEDIHYPVALDNNFVTWQNFRNEYWPAHYLIDKNGNVVYEHFGEGEYDVTENNIRYLLGLKNTASSKGEEEKYSVSETPETYLGFARAEAFFSSEAVAKNTAKIYSYPKILPIDSWALKGSWTIYADKIVANAAGASIKLHFKAGKVYAVMGASIPVNVNLLLDDKYVQALKGKDVANSLVHVSRNQLYSLINSDEEREGILELIATAPGLEIYTFTFGS